MLQLLMFSGIRKEELRHLEWDDVDFENRLLHVRPKDAWRPKTANSVRTNPLCELAIGALHMARERAEKRKVKKLAGLPIAQRPVK